VFSDFSSGLGGGFGQPGVVTSGVNDGNYPGAGGSTAGVGLMPSLSNGAVVVGLIVIFAVILLFAGVISLRAAGEVVI
jgi:hypothetical protein